MRNKNFIMFRFYYKFLNFLSSPIHTWSTLCWSECGGGGRWRCFLWQRKMIFKRENEYQRINLRVIFSSFSHQHHPVAKNNSPCSISYYYFFTTPLYKSFFLWKFKMLIFNYLSTILVLNTKTTQEIKWQFFSIFNPRQFFLYTRHQHHQRMLE